MRVYSTQMTSFFCARTAFIYIYYSSFFLANPKKNFSIQMLQLCHEINEKTVTGVDTVTYDLCHLSANLSFLFLFSRKLKTFSPQMLAKICCKQIKKPQGR